MQFTRKNILFAFENIECERSTSFDVPATPTNNAIFSMAKWVAAYGEGMRQRTTCEMQSGVVVKEGYLYINAYDFAKNVYKAIFITGDLLGLKVIKDAGEIADIIQPLNYTTWGDAVDASAGINAWWQCVKYLQQYEGGTVYPSVQVAQTIQECFEVLGETCVLPTGAEALRVIPSKLEGIAASGVLFKSTQHAPADSTDVANYADVNNAYFSIVDDLICYDTIGVARQESSQAYWEYYGIDQKCKMQGFEAVADINIKFGNDMPDGILMMSSFKGLTIGGVISGVEGSVTNEVGVLWHGYDGTYEVYGTLKNKTVHLAAGTKFTFIPANMLHGYAARSYMSGYTGVCMDAPDLYTYGIPNFEYTVSIETDEPTVGGDVLLYPHLPKCTLVDLLKVVANVYGMVLNYTPGTGVTFETLADIATWNTISLDGKVITKKQMERKFSDYAQNNIVNFDSDDFVKQLERLQINYTVGNVNIETQKELQKIIFSEAAIGSNSNNTDYVPILIRNQEEQETGKDTLCVAGANDMYLGRVWLTKNAVVQSLCTASTRVTLEANMSLLEFQQIQPKVLLLYEGTRYVWTEAQWSQNKATLTLNKMPL